MVLIIFVPFLHLFENVALPFVNRRLIQPTIDIYREY